MTELIVSLQEIRQLGPDVHLLCPKKGDNDPDNYDINDYSPDGENPTSPNLRPAQLARIEEANKRRKKFISTLQLIAYDGKETEQYQRYIWEVLNQALGACDLCIREYYIGKLDLRAELGKEYDDGEVEQFFEIIDARDISRIKEGLVKATECLRALPTQRRTTSALEKQHLHAIFESLVCEAFLKNDSLLEEYFDEPFSLIQSKKKLRIQAYLPAVTRFLFESKITRFEWAETIWKGMKRPPTEVEWNWAMKNVLQMQLRSSSSSESLQKLWFAMKLVVETLGKQEITHYLFDLVPNLCTTALNHLAKGTSALTVIVLSMAIILVKAPEAFWQAMGSISSSTIVEQIFASPNFNKVLQDSTMTAALEKVELFSWVMPFLDSLKPGNRPPACHTLVLQLFDRLKSSSIHERARKSCYDIAVKVMLETIKSFSDHEAVRLSVNRVVLSDTLDIISHRIEDVLTPSNLQITVRLEDKSRSDVLALVRNALALECLSLKADFESLSKSESAHRESTSYSEDIWNGVIKALSEDNVELSMAAVRGIMALPGLERFHAKDPSLLSDKKRSYNEIFNKIVAMESKMLEKIAEFTPVHLDSLFNTQDTNMSLVAALFSADKSTQQSAIELVKNIGGQSGRKEALAQLLDALLDTTIYSICWVFRRILNMQTFEPVESLLVTGMEILDVLCNTEDGILRGRALKAREAQAIQSYWSYQWMALATVFRQTERWSQAVHDKPRMTEVCRNAMQYAEALFEQYDLFASALIRAKPGHADQIPNELLDSSTSNTSGSPLKTLDSMSRWLRLRDEYLADTLVKLIAKMLSRLKSRNVIIKNDGLSYVEEVVTKTTIKTILSDSQKAVLVRALEAYGVQLHREVPKIKKQSTLRDWAESSALDRSGASTPISRDSPDEFDDPGLPDKDLMALMDTREMARATASIKGSQQMQKSIASLTRPTLQKPKPKVDLAMKKLESRAFVENRQREMAAAEQKKKEAAAMLRRGKIGIGEQTKGQGSGLNGIGVKGKDHSSGGPDGIMVSSESESDSDDSDDIALFGNKVGKAPQLNKNPLGLPTRVLATKKVKQQRSQKDVRARLEPDLSALHKTILSWDFFADSDLPPNSAKDDYTLVTNVFKTVADYQNTFEPLLILEAWQSFRSAREDGNFKSIEVTVSNSMIVDSFIEMNSTIKLSLEKKDRPGISVADIVLLSRSKTPSNEPDQPHCLARVKEVKMKKGDLQVVYRMSAANNPLRPYLSDKSIVHGVQVLSMTPLEREYGALKSLEYYDLCEEVIRAKPSPILDYTDSQLYDIVTTFGVNKAQAKAVKCAMDNDAFTLIQGPPGAGKTSTICALVGAMISKSWESSRPRPAMSNRAHLPPPLPAAKKILVCAPSNAAVDELVMRFKSGVKMMNGDTEKLTIVRLGRSDAINANVKDVTLEELVNAKLNMSAPREKEDINSIMMDHQSTCKEFNLLREKISESRARGQQVNAGDETTLDALGRKKKELGSRIDEMRGRQNSAARDAEVNRRKVQQQILNSAHVLCATLSGSGHEIFQQLDVEFETVIIDEAAQSIELSALIPLKYGCSKCILVGDPKQLPPTVLSREASKYQYEQSLFARMEKNHVKDVHLLDTQYRMHPEISLFPSKTFYDCRLKDGLGMAELRKRPWHHSSVLGPYRFFDVQGMSSAAAKGHSLVNIAEINVAMRLYERLVTDVKRYDFKNKIGIITPYKGQLKELKVCFSRRYGSDITSVIEFNTTDAFQGRESEIIIFSCVRASTKGIGFLNDIRRMNVGLTRAKCSLWVLGNSESLVQGEFWKRLVDDAKSRSLYTDGDISGLLQRQLLTEDMMKDDVEMLDSGVSSTSSSRGPSISQSAPSESRRGPSSNQMSSTLRDSKNSAPSPTSSTPLASRPSSSLSARSSSSSVAKSAGFQSLPPMPVVNSRAQDSKPRGAVPASGTSEQTGVRRGSDSTPRSMLYDGRSGGPAGLNDNAACAICGSSAHFSSNCDNEAAREVSLGPCFRCKLPGHNQSSCTEPRCLECGEIGHKSENCRQPLERRLNSRDKVDVKRQEASWIESMGRAKAKRAERMLGEHDPKIPIVKSTLPPSQQTCRDTTGIEPKRKRDDASPTEAPNGPKSRRVETSGEEAGGSHSGDRQPAPPGPVMRGPGKVQGPLVKRRRPAEADMFLKRK